MKEKRVLFVCLGNICRSPLAQGIFEKQISLLGLSEKITADSAGTSGWHKGETPHSGSLRVAKENSVSIENQKSRPVTIHDATSFDWIVAMDKVNYRYLLSEFNVPQIKLLLMRDFDILGKGEDVPDPWGKGKEAFAEVFEILHRSIAEFIKQKFQV